MKKSSKGPHRVAIYETVSIKRLASGINVMGLSVSAMLITMGNVRYQLDVMTNMKMKHEIQTRIIRIPTFLQQIFSEHI